MTLIQKINPLNKEEEKKKFFFDPNYNPQFIYSETISGDELTHYGSIEDTYLQKAENILSMVLKKYGSESKYLEEAEGKILTRAEVEKRIQEYLAENKLEKIVSVHYSSTIVSRTMVHGHDLYVRTPLEYRENSFVGVLDHEVGTHILRRLNEEKQPWFRDREKYKLSDYLETEEGLASLHSQLRTKDKYFWLRSLHYLAVFYGNSMSFSQLYAYLKKYVDDRERRWRVCLRAKRGVTDTSVPAAFSKDQLYLRGLIKVFAWLKEKDFDVRELYLGKISISDIKSKLLQSPNEEIMLPSFYMQGASYKDDIISIMRLNKLA